MDENEKNFWDPLSGIVTYQTFAEQQRDLVNKIQHYQESPYLLRIYFILCCCIPLSAFILFVIYPYDPRFLAVTFLPPIIFYGYVRHLQERIILYLLCSDKKWPYNPATDSVSVEDFAQSFYEVFNKGHDRTFDEQVWGTVKNANGEEDSFWSGKFEYVTGSGRSQSTHTEYVFIFKLPKNISVEFSLYKAGLFKAFEEDIKTESEDFNNAFRIDYNDPDDQTEIIKILSPSVQTRLIDFSRKYKTKQITFVANMMIIALDQDIWKTKYTNFFIEVAIDERDEENYFQSLHDMAELPTEMIQFIT